MTALELRDIHKAFAHGGALALKGVSLSLPLAAYTCVMGASGSGKTTLLRVVAGLERPDRGEVVLAGKVVTQVPAERRPVHTLFQGYALFPHLSAWENVAFAPRLAGVGGAVLRERVLALLADVGLAPRLHARRPAQLSGGERQRVALARALAGAPTMVLLDEPLAALDRPLRGGLRRLLKETQQRRKIGFLHVTHEPEEALALADHLVLMDQGLVLAQGGPAALYSRPPDMASARLLGDLTAVPGEPGRWLRPERLAIGDVSGDMSDATGAWRRALVTLDGVACLGDRWELQLRTEGQRLLARSMNPPASSPGAVVAARWRAEDELALGEAGGRSTAGWSSTALRL
ncbi:MAG TPA: ABC transporter ATP-binding protein [Nannocystis sp.]